MVDQNQFDASMVGVLATASPPPLISASIPATLIVPPASNADELACRSVVYVTDYELAHPGYLSPQLVAEHREQGPPSWFPDGTRIAFTAASTTKSG